MKTTERQTPISEIYKYQPETVQASMRLSVIAPGTVAERSHALGMSNCEPIIIMMDSLIRQAKAHKVRFESPISEDYVLGGYWLKAAVAVRSMCNGDGAVALEKGITTDSKDNGTVEAMFWSAMEIAGFSESDI